MIGLRQLGRRVKTDAQWGILQRSSRFLRSDDNPTEAAVRLGTIVWTRLPRESLRGGYVQMGLRPAVFDWFEPSEVRMMLCSGLTGR